MGYNELSAEDKMAKAFNNLMIIRPFYSSIYSCMERVYTDSVPTMGVSKDRIVINRDFVNELEFGELMFVNLHEITHVALMHVARRKNRDNELWNIELLFLMLSVTHYLLIISLPHVIILFNNCPQSFSPHPIILLKAIISKIVISV